jgi:hypothetical protein
VTANKLRSRWINILNLENSKESVKMEFKGYKCFSVPQKNFLLSKGLEYIIVALDPKSHYTFWLFLRNDELDKALTEWQQNNPKNQ